MARKPRIYYKGAVYHIMNRGNRKSSIFMDDKDRFRYLDLLEETRVLYPFILHSYCLMTTHNHLLLETIDHHPQDIMKRLNSLYGIYFNKRHDLVGHVFQGRYRAELIDSDYYFLNAGRYIHLNPVEGNIVSHPADYKWSSYTAYVTNQTNPHISTERTLSYFQEPQKETYQKIIEYEAERIKAAQQNPVL